jgi:hypothetical protein
VTILDDNQPPPPPPPTFTIGGTVDGLQGSGLVLSNLGAEVPVSANGSFTFPGTATNGQGSEANVTTQPHAPDQVCTVDHGNNTDGTLDTSFATNGVLTADFRGRGEFGQDVALDPQGRIVAAGYTANGGGTEFALMRANP